MKVPDPESILKTINPAALIAKEIARIRASIKNAVRIDVRASEKDDEKLRVQEAPRDKHYLLSLRSLLVELSRKIKDLALTETFTDTQTPFVPLNLQELVQQVDDLYLYHSAEHHSVQEVDEVFDLSTLYDTFAKKNSMTNKLSEFSAGKATRDSIKTGVIDPLVLFERKASLREGLAKLSEKIRALGARTGDPEFEFFHSKIIESIAMLLSDDEDVPMSGLLSDKDRGNGGGNSGNGSGYGGGGFPGPNCKLMSNNRSMPWHQPRHFL
jgi:hypothetical protein